MSAPNPYRSHAVGLLRGEHIGREVVLSGWAQSIRRFKRQSFVELRKETGCVQLVVAAPLCEGLTEESTVRIRGLVVARQSPHPQLALYPTGAISSFALISAATHDLTPIKDGLLDESVGVIQTDRWYVGRATQKALQEKHISLWARPRQTAEQPFSPAQKCVYPFREIVEWWFSKLKMSFDLVPKFPPRRWNTAVAHILESLLAYNLSDRKPTMHWSPKHFDNRRQPDIPLLPWNDCISKIVAL